MRNESIFVSYIFLNHLPSSQPNIYTHMPQIMKYLYTHMEWMSGKKGSKKWTFEFMWREQSKAKNKKEATDNNIYGKVTIHKP